MTPTPITVEEAMEIASYFTAIDREQGELLRGFLSQYASVLAERDGAISRVDELLALQAEDDASWRQTKHELDEATTSLSASIKREAELVEALRPFGEFYDCIDREYPEDEDYYNEVGEQGHHGLKPIDFRRAHILTEGK